ncbi:flavin reductase family protein [Rhodococcus artemisiae]|uniref:Flavin reductase family protein n=1 Tax=Rhodococcus artemisiae TaxID=714159 RepID=A0ABU7L6Y3_9NOCA|nr:flavin reductase family protein [Rhodococcus artemisiae]MEE2057289.1 flavin reductase family protein [Rhodococcus artemisiae]
MSTDTTIDIDIDIDQGLFREVMGHYPTGVAVVTGRADDGELLALVVGTFSSVSLEPPLVSFMPMKTSKSFDKLRRCDSVCINILGGEQEDLVSTIARRWENKFDGIDWFGSPSGDPVLEQSVAWIDARITNTLDAGDHWIILCSVNDMAVTNPVVPLIYFQGGYGSFVSTSLMARMDHEIMDEIHDAEIARPDVEALARAVGCEVILYTAISRDEMATVLSAVGPAIDRENGLARRIPIVPPIGDSVVFDRADDEQEQWLAKAHGVDESVKGHYRQRIMFLRTHGYVLSLLPQEGIAAYDTMCEATRRYECGRLTPLQERDIRASIVESTVDYRPRELEPECRYNVGSVVLPVRNRDGNHTLTLRLAQLPTNASGATVADWISRAKAVVAVLEGRSGRQ